MRPRTVIMAGALMLLVAVIVGFALAGAEAQETRLEVDVDTVHRGDPGELFFEGSYNAEAGEECVATLESVTNNESIHPGNDLIVGPVTFTNIESGSFEAAGIAFIADGPGDVMVRLGADGVFSAGFTLEVTCNPPTTTTQPPESSTTTTLTIPPTTTTTTNGVTTSIPSATTTTTPPPINGVDTGGGACADGACEGSLSPLATWLTMLAVFALATGSAWAFMRAWTRGRPDG